MLALMLSPFSTWRGSQRKSMKVNRSRYTCPICREPLCLGPATNDVPIFLWCGTGRCKNKAANNGAHGKTEDEAFSALLENIDREES